MNRYVSLLSSAAILIGCGTQQPITPTPAPVAQAPQAGASATLSTGAGRGASQAGGASGSVAPGSQPSSAAGGVAGPGGGSSGSAGAAQGATGGSAGAAAPPSYAPRFSAIYSEILQAAHCSIPTCHGTALALETMASAYTSLVGVMSSGPICGGSGKVLVMAGAPDQSLLVQKLREAPPCGDRMPPGNPLNDQQLMQVVTWIQSGAQND